MTTVAKISKKAKQIRRKGESWQDAISRASKMLTSHSPSKKAAKKKTAKKKATRKKADYHQTGKRKSLKRDKQIRAKAPGKRKVKSGSGSHTYYERRANRSDKPGSLTGINSAASTYRYNVTQRITSNVRLLNESESRLDHLKKKLRDSVKQDKPRIRLLIADQRKYIKQLKRDISGFKSLLK